MSAAPLRRGGFFALGGLPSSSVSVPLARVSRFSPDQLRDQALLALEDAVQECRYRTPRRGFTLRFALAYLHAVSGDADPTPFRNFWCSLGRPLSPWSFSVANVDLLRIYRVLGVERDDAVEASMWRRWAEQEGSGGPH